MKSNFSYFVKFVYYTYIIGLILLFLDILSFVTAFMFLKGNLFLILPYLQMLFPLAGVSGLIPVVIISYILQEILRVFISDYAVKLLIPFVLLPFAIFLQKKVVDGIRIAIKENSKDSVFNVVILHHLWTNGCLFYVVYFIHDRAPIPIFWPLVILINFLIALGVWRWTKIDL